jgi:hypothetical protein
MTDSPAGAGDALTDLLATAQTLLRGSISQRPQARPSAARHEPEQLAFGLAPNARSPRLLVPLVPKKAAGNALRRFSTATPLRAAASRALVSKAVSLMPGRVLRDQISIESRETGLADHLSDVLGEQVTLSLGIGKVRVNRKPVLQVFDRRGNTVAFAKIGHSDVSRQDVTAEGRALSLLGGRQWIRLRAPQLISETDWRGMRVLLMSALEVPPLQWPWERWKPPLAAMSELSSAFSAGSVRLCEAPWIDRQRQLGSKVRDDSLLSRFARCVDFVCRWSGEDLVPFSCWHGDWTAWNMGRARGKVLVWDWERFETAVPSGLDPLHYHVNSVTVRSGSSAAAFRRGIALSFGGAPRPGSPQHLRACLYLIAITARYLGLIETPRGADIAPRAADALSALEKEIETVCRPH